MRFFQVNLQSKDARCSRQKHKNAYLNASNFYLLSKFLHMTNNNDKASRRKFLQQIGATGLAFAGTPLTTLSDAGKAEERILRYDRKISANDKVRLAVIGFGIQGHFDLGTALKVPGVELAGICDL